MTLHFTSHSRCEYWSHASTQRSDYIRHRRCHVHHETLVFALSIPMSVEIVSLEAISFSFTQIQWTSHWILNFIIALDPTQEPSFWHYLVSTQDTHSSSTTSWFLVPTQWYRLAVLSLCSTTPLSINISLDLWLPTMTTSTWGHPGTFTLVSSSFISRINSALHT